MSNQGQGFDEPFSFSEDVSAKQFHLVKDGATAGTVLLADTAGGVVRGIIQDTGLNGSSTPVHGLVRVSGESQVKIGGNISIGDPLQADTDAMAIVATTGDYVFARALEAGVDGDIIRAQLTFEGTF